MKLLNRVANILLKPRLEWDAIKRDPLTIGAMFTGYAMILAAIPAVAGFIGYAWIGVALPFFGRVRYPIGRGLFWAVLTYVLQLVTVYVLAAVLDFLAPRFGGKRDLTASAKVAVFGYTAVWIGASLSFLPELAWVGSLVGLYSLLLFWMGIKALKEVPAARMMGCFVSTMLVAIVLFMLIGFLVGAVAFGGGIGAGAFGNPS